MVVGTTAAVIGGAALVGSSLLGSSAAKKAGSVQARAAEQAGERELEMFYQNREDMLPFREAGVQSIGRLGDLMGTSENTEAEGFGSLASPFSAEKFEKDPGYNFRLEEGQKALERSQSSRGGLLSGAASKALSRYNQDYASQEYGTAYNRYNADQGTLYNRLAGLAGSGQTAAANIANLGAGATSRAGQYTTSAAAARAGGIVGSANAYQSGLSSLSNFAGGFSPGGGGGGSANTYNPQIRWRN